MDSDSVSANSSRGGAATVDVVDKTEIWSAWKQCESMLKDNNYMVELPCVKTSSRIAQITSEMFNRIATMFDEMKIIKDEELSIPDELEDIRDDENMQPSNSADEEESEWEEEVTTSGKREYISLKYKKKVVAMAKAHPKWSLATLQKRGAGMLKKKAYLKIWEAEIVAGGTAIEKYEAINDMTFKRFEQARENSEQVTTSTLQQWARTYARELNCDRFTACTTWVNKFKRKYGIRQSKTTRYVSSGEVASIGKENYHRGNDGANMT